MPSAPPPRIYPMPFAREVLDRVELLKSTCKGKPGTPTHVPPATETFARAGWPQSDSWTFAGLSELYNYLRACKKLRIPSEWSYVVPVRMPVPAGED